MHASIIWEFRLLCFPATNLWKEPPILAKLAEYQIDLIVLAGFMNKISDALLTAYPGKIINIHPALLPKHGGKGMYGMHVHEAVVAAGEKESGITIHYINENYDEGDIIFQAKCEVLPADTLKKWLLKCMHWNMLIIRM